MNLGLGYFIGEMNFFTQMLNFLGIVASISLLQLGGIPVPAGRAGCALWATLAFVVLFQLLLQVLGIALLGISFGKMRGDLGPCAKEWAHGYELVDVVAVPTFLMQPVVLVRFVLLHVYYAALIEVVKVYAAVRGGALLENVWGVKWFVVCGPFMRSLYVGDNEMKGVTFDWALILGLVHHVTFPALLYSLLLWVCSLSFLFGLTVFSPIAAALILGELVVLGFIALVHQAVDELGDCIPGKVKAMLLSVTWWPAAESVLYGFTSAFTCTLFFAFITVALSPFVVNGSWLAAYLYAGHATEASSAFIADIYTFTFAGTFALPSFNFDLTQLGAALAALPDVLTLGFAGLDMPGYLELTQASALLSFFFGILKTAVSAVAAVLAGWEKCIDAKEPVQFSEIAQAGTPGDWAEVVMEDAEGKAAGGKTANPIADGTGL